MIKLNKTEVKKVIQEYLSCKVTRIEIEENKFPTYQRVFEIWLDKDNQEMKTKFFFNGYSKEDMNKNVYSVDAIVEQCEFNLDLL